MIPIFLLLVFFPLFSPSGFAGITSVDSISPASSALGSATVALPLDPLSLGNNPAGLAAFTRGKNLQFQYGIKLLEPEFSTMNNIVLENASLSQDVVLGNVSPNNNGFLGQSLGITFGLCDWQQLTVGLTLFSPLGYLANFDSGLPYAPSYARYGSAIEHPDVQLAIGMLLAPGLSIGLGAKMGFHMLVTGDLFLKQSQTATSSMALSSQIKPLITPVLGILWKMNERLAFGFSAQPFTLKYPSELNFNSNVTVWQNTIPLIFHANTDIYYDPATFRLGANYHLKNWEFLAQLDGEFWSGYQPPVMLVESDPAGITFAETVPPSADMRNILIGRLGAQWQVADLHQLRAGFAYRPSILNGFPTGVGNTLDATSFELRAGYEYLIKQPFKTQTDLALQAALGLNWLENSQVTKTAGSETGVATDPKIGYPGYPVGGKVWIFSVAALIFY
jgi:long-subunit fatty acid transport protein